MEDLQFPTPSLKIIGCGSKETFPQLKDERTSQLLEGRSQARRLVVFAVSMLRKFGNCQRLATLLLVLFGPGCDKGLIIKNLMILAEHHKWSWALAQDVVLRDDHAYLNRESAHEEKYWGPQLLVRFYQDSIDYVAHHQAWADPEGSIIHFRLPQIEQLKDWSRLVQDFNANNMQEGEPLDDYIRSLPFTIIRLMAEVTFDAKELMKTIEDTIDLADSEGQADNYYNSTAYGILVMSIYHAARGHTFNFNRPHYPLERRAENLDPALSAELDWLFVTELQHHGLFGTMQRDHEFIHLDNWAASETKYPVIILSAPITMTEYVDSEDIYGLRRGAPRGDFL